MNHTKNNVLLIRRNKIESNSITKKKTLLVRLIPIVATSHSNVSVRCISKTHHFVGAVGIFRLIRGRCVERALVGHTHSFFPDQLEAEAPRCNLTCSGTYIQTVQPIKNAVFIDDNNLPVVGSIKTYRYAVLGTW